MQDQINALAQTLVAGTFFIAVTVPMVTICLIAWRAHEGVRIAKLLAAKPAAK